MAVAFNLPYSTVDLNASEVPVALGRDRVSAKPRQSAFDQKTGVYERIADTVTVAHQLGFELPTLRTAWRHTCKLGDIK